MLETNPSATFIEDEQLQAEALIRFIAESLHYSDTPLDDPNLEKYLGKDFVDAVRSTPIPRKKWRKELWKRLIETSYQSPTEKQMKAKGKLTHGGYALSCLQVMLKTIESEDAASAIGLNQLELKSIADGSSALERSIAELDSESGDQIQEGYYAGKAAHRGAKYWIDATSATSRHFLMLILGDQLENMRSVDLMYGHLKEVLGDRMHISQNSFKEFCSEIGLQGKRYKRLKSN